MTVQGYLHADYFKTCLQWGRLEGLAISRSKSLLQAGCKRLRDRPLSLPMQRTPLCRAYLYKRDSSLEIHAKNEFLTSIAIYAVRRHIFLSACRIIPRHIARLKVFNQSQSKIPQSAIIIQDYQFQVKNNFSKAPLPFALAPYPRDSQNNSANYSRKFLIHPGQSDTWAPPALVQGPFVL